MLEYIFEVSQIIAAAAVVASLLYLARQLRQTERIQRATMQLGRADRTTQASLAIANPELARVFEKGMDGDTVLSREEFTQWLMICRAVFLSGEDAFLQHEAGLLPEPAFDSNVAGLKFFISMPGVRAVWKLSEGQFGRDFRAFANSILAQTPPVRSADVYAEWQKLLRSEPSGAPGETPPLRMP